MRAGADIFFWREQAAWSTWRYKTRLGRTEPPWLVGLARAELGSALVSDELEKKNLARAFSTVGLVRAAGHPNMQTQDILLASCPVYPAF